MSEAYLTEILKGLVEHPASVHIEKSIDEQGTLLTLEIHADDMGRVIGKSGSTAKAIRTLIRAEGMRYDARVSLKIKEPADGKHADLPPKDLKAVIGVM